MRTRIAAIVALAAAVTVLAGCGSSGSTETTSTAETTQGGVDAPTTSTEATPPAPKPKPKPTPSQPESPVVITVRVVDGVPVGGIARPSVKKGDRVVLVVRSDVADEVHLHGYDVSREVAAGGSARLPFVAKIPGRFEVELEQSGVQIAELTVR